MVLYEQDSMQGDGESVVIIYRCFYDAVPLLSSIPCITMRNGDYPVIKRRPRLHSTVIVPRIFVRVVSNEMLNNKSGGCF